MTQRQCYKDNRNKISGQTFFMVAHGTFGGKMVAYNPANEELARKIKEIKKTLSLNRSWEKGLKKCEEKYEAVIECVLDCVCIYDFKGKRG